MLEYKILTFPPALLKGVPDEKIEKTLNEHGAQGWRVVGTVQWVAPQVSATALVYTLERPKR